MTRFGFFLFNILLIIVLYGFVCIDYPQAGHHAAAGYILRTLSIPYICLVLLMAIISTVRWFMNHDPDIASEIVTWITAFILVPAATVLALYLIGGIEGGFMAGLKSLM
jgi:hypothetical protein